jgi:Ca2+-binding RTX toxin-like protein
MTKRLSLIVAVVALCSASLAGNALAVGYTCNDKAATKVGTPGNDDITTGGGDDVIVTLAGNDVVHSGGGDDTICTGRGNDQIYSSLGADELFGGPDADLLTGGRGADYEQGQAGQDIFNGQGGNDTLYAVDGEADSLTAGAGAFDNCYVDVALDAYGSDCEMVTG